MHTHAVQFDFVEIIKCWSSSSNPEMKETATNLLKELEKLTKIRLDELNEKLTSSQKSTADEAAAEEETSDNEISKEEFKTLVEKMQNWRTLIPSGSPQSESNS